MKYNIYPYLKTSRKIYFLFTFVFIFLSKVLLAAPTNDNCTNAINLTPGASGVPCSSTAGTVAAATASTPTTTCTGTANDDVWYKFTATSTSHTISVTGSASFDAVFEFFSGTCGSLTSIACKDGTFDGGTETATQTGLTIGNTYYVRVYDYYTGIPTTPTFTICITTPPPPP